MPRLALQPFALGNPIPLAPAGGALAAPRVQFRCWVRLPGHATPRDGIVDTGAPFSWLPEALWQRLRPGTDFEWLPFAPGYGPPRAVTAGWGFSFRFARLLAPLVLLDSTGEWARPSAVVQFADGNPPARGAALPYFVIGLWGGLLEGARLTFGPGPTPSGALEW